jgi:hypothetical protein
VRFDEGGALATGMAKSSEKSMDGDMVTARCETKCDGRSGGEQYWRGILNRNARLRNRGTFLPVCAKWTVEGQPMTLCRVPSFGPVRALAVWELEAALLACECYRRRQRCLRLCMSYCDCKLSSVAGGTLQSWKLFL